MYSGVTDFLIATAGFSSTFSGSTAWREASAQSAVDRAYEIRELIVGKRIMSDVRRHDIGRQSG